MIYNDIRAALELRLSTIPNIPPVTYENLRITRQEGDTYLEVSLVPIRTRIRTILGDSVVQRYQGWFQVRIMTPLFDGVGDNLDLADYIATFFSPGSSIETPLGNHVTIEYAEIGNKSIRDTHFSTILNIGWYCYS
jgi:hypothetical protein